MSYYDCPYCGKDATHHTFLVDPSYDFKKDKKCVSCGQPVKYNVVKYIGVYFIIRPILFFSIAIVAYFLHMEIYYFLSDSKFELARVAFWLYFMMLIPIAIIVVYTFPAISNYIVGNWLKIKVFEKDKYK